MDFRGSSWDASSRGAASRGQPRTPLRELFEKSSLETRKNFHKKGGFRSVGRRDVKFWAFKCVRCALVSNNKPERVTTFNASLGLPAYADCGKPSRKHLRRALDGLGVPASEAAVLGDQIFTDCLSARRMGMKAFIVPPIRDKRTLFFRFKRALEKPVLRAYDRRARRAAKHNTL